MGTLQTPASQPAEFIYDTPLWKVRRLGADDHGRHWYQGETPLWPAPTTRTRDFEEARRWIETQVQRFLAANGYESVESTGERNARELVRRTIVNGYMDG